MAYLTREDGERFVIPAYRDVLSAKKSALLKKEILLLSGSYGEYITLQKKGNQYEVAFSPDNGFLLGETVWHYFKRPRDLIYCEAIPNTTEVILVIVKSGSVYLDGSFPADTVPEELIVFQTQQNSFEIMIFGDVPISQHPDEGKFVFDESRVKSFQTLDKSAFNALPRVKAFQLQLVNVILKQHGIGVFPLGRMLLMAFIIGGGIFGYYYFTQPTPIPLRAPPPPPNPFANYIQALLTPEPAAEIEALTNQVLLLYTLPGWMPMTIEYAKGISIVTVISKGAETNLLFEWARKNNAEVIVTDSGFSLKLHLSLPNRTPPQAIAPINELIGTITDKLSEVYPGNHLKLGKMEEEATFKQVSITIDFVDITPTTFNLIGERLGGLPLVLSQVKLAINDDRNLTGSFILNALGN